MTWTMRPMFFAAAPVAFFFSVAIAVAMVACFLVCAWRRSGGQAVGRSTAPVHGLFSIVPTTIVLTA